MNNYLDNPQNTWFVTNMGPLEWIETLLKTGAIGIAVFALTQVIDQGFQPVSATRMAEIVLMGIASFGLVMAVYDRLKTREVVSITFVLVNNIGHWSMFTALIGGINISWPVIGFCGLMIAGDLIKFRFFLKTGYTVRNSPRMVLLGMIGVYLMVYAAVLLIEVF